jgi:hypothetical protein
MDAISEIMAQQEFVADLNAIEVPPDASPLDFLCRVFRDSRQPLSARLKAAGLAAPFVHPKLAVTAVIQEGGSIASKIEAARNRSEGILEARWKHDVEQEVERRLTMRAIPAPVTYTKAEGPLPQGRAPTPIGAPMARMRRS